MIGNRRGIHAAAFSLLLIAAGASAASADEPAWRMIDALAPFYDPEKPAPRSWAMPFAHLDTAAPPYVDTAHLERALTRFERYVDLVARRGYNAVFFGNLIHMASFDGVPRELGRVYAEDSPYRLRAAVYRQAFKRAVALARKRGVRVVIETDFPAWTPPLKRWLGRGGAGLENPRWWAAMRAALEEVLHDVGADGLSLRIGEGGGAYDEGATRYHSGITVRTVAQAQLALRRLLEIVDGLNSLHQTEKKLLFRTWTIGIGELGRLHTSPELYERVFRPFYGSPSLITMIKHVAMDFFVHAPLNPTIGVGELPQVVEFQARREYEGFGLFPNYRAESFRAAMQRFRNTKTFAGISVWPTNGGFLLTSRTVYGVHGPDAWIDLNVHAYGRLVRDPTIEPAALVREWAREQGLSPRDGQRLARILLQTDDLVARGMYLAAYARNAPALFGVDHFPPMLWIYWTRPVGAYGVQYLVGRWARGVHETTLREGHRAVAGLDALLQEARGLAPSRVKTRLLRALRYQRSLFALLARYREVFLNHHRWALTGDAEAYTDWRAALPMLAEAMIEHRGAWEADPELPAMDLRELVRVLHDDAWIPRLRPAAGALALVLLLLAWACGSVLGPDRPRWADRPGQAIVMGLLASLAFGAGAVVLLAGHRAWSVLCVSGLPLLLGVLLVGGSLRLVSATEEPERSPWANALATLVVPLATLSLALLVFAWRGPVPLYALGVEAILGGRVQLLVLGGLGLAAALELASLAWVARRCLPGSWAKGLGLVAVQLVVVAGVATGATRIMGAQGLLALNDALRVGPSILGEAGTGVEDLVGDD